MTTQNNHPQRMMNAFKQARADIASLADRIECELQKSDKDDKVTWASVGTLEDVREHLVETLAIFCGVESSEIKRRLDEPHR